MRTRSRGGFTSGRRSGTCCGRWDFRDDATQTSRTPSLDTRTDLSDNRRVRGAEFERRVQKLARSKKVTYQFVADKGKGSHGRLYFGEEFTTLKDRKKEIGRDLLAKMCRDLQIGLVPIFDTSS